VGKVSIIVPTLNEENHVGSLLSDVSEQTKEPDEIIIVNSRSKDGTVSVVERFPNVELLIWSPPVASPRNLGGQGAIGDVLVFLDADVRLPKRFLEDFLEEFERRQLDIACPLYMPYRSTPAINAIHVFFNAAFVVFQKVLPSGAGHCIVIKREVFQRSRGFDPNLNFDDIELIRRLSKQYRFVSSTGGFSSRTGDTESTVSCECSSGTSSCRFFSPSAGSAGPTGSTASSATTCDK
jgi:glycosyltransferase involved in cell wall biosynthesis